MSEGGTDSPRTNTGDNTKSSGSVISPKDVLSLVGGVAGVAYALGFLVVNSSLVTWGIIDLSPLKPHYVAVGLLFVIHLVLLVAFPFGLFFSLLRSDRTSKAVRGATILEALAAIFLAWGLSVVWSFFTSTSFWLGDRWEYWRAFGYTWFLEPFLIWLLAGSITGVILAFAVSGRGSHHRWLGILQRQWLGTAAMALGFAALIAYSLAIYPRTVPSIGGGDFFLVRLVPSEKGDIINSLTQPDPSKLSITADTTKPVRQPTRWVWLLDQSEKMYFILVCSEEKDAKDMINTDWDKFRAVELQKELVAGVIHYNQGLDKNTR
jgi:hypothetical protein